MVRTRTLASRRPVVAALLCSAMLLIGVGQGAARADVTAVSGSAYGYFSSLSLFGGAAIARGPAPTVTLPAGGSASPITSMVPTGSAQYGPAIVFTSGPITVSTQGTTGASGAVTSSTSIQTVNTSGQEVFTAASVTSTCTASEAGTTRSAAIANGTLQTSDGNPNVDGDETTVTIPANPPPNTTISGRLNATNDSFRYVFNEQTVNPNGSVTVNAAHQYLLGPTAVGDLIIGQSICGATAVDKSAPETTIDSGPSGTTSTVSPSFGFSSSEGGSTFECRLDGPDATANGSYTPCSSPKSYTNLADGAYTFSVRASDAAGNTDATPATRAFTVDTGAPQTTIDSGPSGSTSSASPSFGFFSSQAGSTFECRLDGPGAATGAYGACASPKSYANLADGVYTFSVRATNAAGVTDAIPAMRTFTLDTSPPQTTIEAGPSGATSSVSPSFVFSSSEGGSTFECKLDGPGAATGSYGACASPKAYTNLADGSYTFSVRATNAANATDATPATRAFRVDTTPPQTAIDSGPSGPSSSVSPSFGFSSSVGDSTFQCKLDGPGAATGTYAPCSSLKSYASLADGVYTFSVRATNAANATDPTPATRTFTVDTTAPQTTIDSGPSGSTSSVSPSFGFSSSEAGSTFECKLDGPGAAGGNYAACSSPKSFANLADGSYTFSVRARDAAGNTDSTPATRTFAVGNGQPAPRPPARDTTRPLLLSLSVSPARFAAAGRGSSIAARVGSRVSYRLSEPATVGFRVERGLPGRRARGSCVRPTRSNRRAKRCTRYATMRGAFTHKGTTGPNRFKFSGRLRSRRLAPGRYRLRAVATDPAGNKSRTKRSGFRIVRP